MARVIQSVVTIGDSYLSGSRSRRSIASRVAEHLRMDDLALVPIDASGGGLRGAQRAILDLPDHHPLLVVVALGADDAQDSPSPAWWIPDADGLLSAALAIAPHVVLVRSPSPPGLSSRQRRWHDRTLRDLRSVSLVVDRSTLPPARFLTAEQSAVLGGTIASMVSDRVSLLTPG